VKSTELRTLADLPFYVLERFSKPALVRRCVGDGFQDYSTQQYFERIHALTVALVDLGIQPGDRVAIISESRPEWGIADFAIMTAGAVSVPIYPTLSAVQASYILEHSGSAIAVVSDRAQLEKVLSVRADVPSLRVVIVIEATSEQPRGDLRILTLDSAFERGRSLAAQEPDAVARQRQRAAALDPAGVATIIYTSGTTGVPKGVMLSHLNLMTNVRSTQRVLELTPDDVALSFLPLSHSYERLVFYQYLNQGMTVAFAESLQTVARDLAAVRPTVMVGVPRVYEKFYSAVFEKVAQGPALRRRLFHKALPAGIERFHAQLEGRSIGPLATLWHKVADRLVFSKIRERTGGRLRYPISGSAALQHRTAEFFGAVGMPIIEGYGLTEASPVLSVNPPNRPRIGSVGKPVPDVAIRIATDGEIQANGPNIMIGYYRDPEGTRAVLTDDGWLMTGDIGRFDSDGYLYITDRKKEILITAGGKNIAPQPVESSLRAHRLVAEAVLIGEGRNYPVALMVPDFPALEERFAGQPWISEPREALVRRQEVLAAYQALVDELNENLAQFERIKRIAVLPREFSVETGELTPTMKVRRKSVEERWRDVIESLYRRDTFPA
jgi:long-chain acyl-CoA synthetase